MLGCHRLVVLCCYGKAVAQEEGPPEYVFEFAAAGDAATHDAAPHGAPRLLAHSLARLRHQGIVLLSCFCAAHPSRSYLAFSRLCCRCRSKACLTQSQCSRAVFVTGLQGNIVPTALNVGINHIDTL